MTIGITGASGHLGRATAERLLERLDPAEIVLITRDPAKLEDLTQRGADVRHGDLDDASSLPAAFAGVTRLLVISTDAVGRRVGQHTTAFQAASQAGVEHVAYTSFVNPTEDNPAFVSAEHRGTEEALRASGLAWTLLRASVYAEFTVDALEQAIAAGQFVHNQGDGLIAHMSREDLAAVASVVLTTEGHEGEAYDVTGPELLSGADLAAIAAEVGGVAVEEVAVDDDAYVAGLVEHAGLPEPVAQGLATFGRAIREGHLAVRTSVVEELTGTPARHVRDLLAARLADRALIQTG